MKNIFKNNIVFLLFFASSVVILIISILSSTMMSNSAKMIEETSKNQMVALSRAASFLATAEDLDEIRLIQSNDAKNIDSLKEDMDNPVLFEDLRKKLDQFTVDSGIAYTYFMWFDSGNNMMQFVLDNETPYYYVISSPQVDREESPDIALRGTANAVPLGTYSQGWSGYISAFAPVYHIDGSLSSYIAGVDMLDIYITQARNNIYTLSMFLIISMVIVLGTCLVCMLLYRKKAKQSEAASISKSTFLSNMSHEIRTPMNAIIGMTKIANQSNDTERLKYCLSTIETSSTHLLGIINDILDMSKIEAGKFELSNSSINIEKMLMKISNLLIDKIDQKSQKFNLILDAGMDMEYIGDELRLSQVITNLLSNAFKFTAEGGRITLTVDQIKKEPEQSVLRFAVTDTGIGMTAQQVDRLFQSFQQADGSISRRFGGTGLGLVISKRIIEKMDGRIWVESELGKGSTFAFEIKLKCLRQESEKINLGNINPSDLHVLVVDEDSDIIERFTAIAEHIGINVETAGNAEKAEYAITEAKENIKPYDIVFIGYNMTGTNALQMISNLGDKIDNSSIVIMTSFLQWNEIEEAADSIGICSFITKPLFPSAVIKAITDVAGKTSAGGNVAKTPLTIAQDFSDFSLLLAEDVEINREIFIALLEDTKINIDSAENGLVAVQKFKAEPDKYDLIIMDVQMPQMDGYQATQTIRAINTSKAKTIPIIAMTANVFKEDIDRCIASGMNDHLSKPIDEKALIEKITFYLHNTCGRQNVE